MEMIDRKKLEECLNSIPMDDPHEGRRPAADVAQLYFETNCITIEELSVIKSELDSMVQAQDIDAEYDRTLKMFLYFSQKFGSKHEEYMGLLAKAVEERERIKDARQALMERWQQQPVSFFNRDAQWYYAGAESMN